jgi:hypothetical protein
MRLQTDVLFLSQGYTSTTYMCLSIHVASLTPPSRSVAPSEPERRREARVFLKGELQGSYPTCLERKTTMSNQPQNETQTPEQLCQSLMGELEASQQAIAELSKASQQVITELLEALEQFSQSFVTEQNRCQRLESSTFPQFDPSANPFARRKESSASIPSRRTSKKEPIS